MDFKRIALLSLLVCYGMSFASVIVEGLVPPFSGGSGTLDDPYRISSVAGLEEIDDNLNASYILTSDINLHGINYSYCVIASETPGGFDGYEYTYPTPNPFRGTFDGNGFAIKNAKATIFGSITGTVKNLRVVNCNVDGFYRCGGLVETNHGNISNCSVSGYVRGGHGHVGLIAGYNSGDIEECYSTGTAKVLNDIGGGDIIAWEYSCGGLVGYNSRGTIQNCFSTATVQNDTTQNYNDGFYSYAGGLVGYVRSGTVSKCYSTGAVSRTGVSYIDGQAGGLIGYNDSGLVYISVWDMQTSAQVTSSGGTGKMTSQMAIKNTYVSYGWDFYGSSSDGTDDIWYLNGQPYPLLNGVGIVGYGSESLPYLIWNASDLITVLADSDNWDKYIQLQADINMKDVDYPLVATDWQDTFTGTFDGNEKIISDLSVSRFDSDIVSLLGVVGEGGVVKNLGLEAASIATENGVFVGGIASWCWGDIENCFVTGWISGDTQVGGITAGLSGNGQIKDCYSNCSIVVKNLVGGGIVADMSENAYLENCYATGYFTGEWVGGVVAKISDNAAVNSTFYNTDRILWSALGEGKSTEQLSAKQTFIDAGWFTDSTWSQVEGGMPVLSWYYGRFDANLDGNQVVNMADFAMLASEYQWPDSEIKFDIYKDGVINSADIMILAQQWLSTDLQ